MVSQATSNNAFRFMTEQANPVGIAAKASKKSSFQIDRPSTAQNVSDKGHLTS
jgi:hypothetical protein